MFDYSSAIDSEFWLGARARESDRRDAEKQTEIEFSTLHHRHPTCRGVPLWAPLSGKRTSVVGCRVRPRTPLQVNARANLYEDNTQKFAAADLDQRFVARLRSDFEPDVTDPVAVHSNAALRNKPLGFRYGRRQAFGG